MAGINWSSILGKAQAHINKPETQKEIRKKMDAVMLGIAPNPGGCHTPEEAADKFIEVLGKTIDSSGLSPEAVEAVKHLNYTKPYKLNDGTYLVTVYFDVDMSRPSLSAKYDGINDIAELLNDGVDHTMNRVWGEWHGRHIGSRTTIPGAHFMEQAIIDFMGNYASEYNVIDLKLNRD